MRSVGEGGGTGNLRNAWNGIKSLGSLRYPVVLLHDCDSTVTDASWPEERPLAFRRRIEQASDNPIQKGIENLFSRVTLEGAIHFKPDFIDIDRSHERVRRGQSETVPEKWTVNANEKTNLCNWICENGKEEDFQGFVPVLDVLKEVLENVTQRANPES